MHLYTTRFASPSKAKSIIPNRCVSFKSHKTPKTTTLFIYTQYIYSSKTIVANSRHSQFRTWHCQTQIIQSTQATNICFYLCVTLNTYKHPPESLRFDSNANLIEVKRRATPSSTRLCTKPTNNILVSSKVLCVCVWVCLIPLVVKQFSRSIANHLLRFFKHQVSSRSGCVMRPFAYANPLNRTHSAQTRRYHRVDDDEASEHKRYVSIWHSPLYKKLLPEDTSEVFGAEPRGFRSNEQTTII